MFNVIKKSSKNTIIIIYIFIALSILTSVVISSWIQYTMDNRYHQFMYVNEELTELPILIEESQKSFNRYIRERKIQDLNSYQETNYEIHSKLELIEKRSIQDDEIKIFHGSLERMHSYQIDLANKIIFLDLLTMENYKDISYISELFRYMVNQANHLTTTYLEYSSHEYNNLLQTSKNIKAVILVVIVLLAGVSIFMGIFLSNGIFQTLQQLSEKARLLSKGRWETDDLKSVPYDELNNVVQAFNQMKYDIKRNLEELKYKSYIEKKLQQEKLHNLEKNQLLKKSQIQSLQMQMNPHFLFNTLNMMSRTVKLKDLDTSVKLIESTASILRYNLETTEDLVLLKDELHSLRAYIYIQQLRFQERIKFSVEGETQFLETFIQPMILQPLVENAIIHGLSNRVKNGEIRIIFSSFENKLKIEIIDNGKGMGEEKIKEILSDQNVTNQSIGLANIKKRLELHFGINHSFKIYSSLNKGTTIEIIIPSR